MKPRQNDVFSTCEVCMSCCCQNARPPITQKRRKIIEDYLLAQGLRVDKSFEISEYVFPRETRDGFCVFFDEETRRCRVYVVKPETWKIGETSLSKDVLERLRNTHARRKGSVH
jgi:Fe-S-cluster containining protein